MEEDYRQLSELQHFIFCRRQWALIHVKQQWAENVRTVEGEIMHQKVHDESKSESRGDILTIRGMRVKSDYLEVVGICDEESVFRAFIAFHKSEKADIISYEWHCACLE